jgi:penicillin-binding protein 2
MLTTPLQLAVMTSRLVNGGHAVKPWIIGYTGDKPGGGTTWPLMGVNQKHLALVREGMAAVVNGERGTAAASKLKAPDIAELKMGGKTGTAQVKRITKQERALGIKNETLPWRYRHHALFVGYAPLDNPRYACAIVIEHGGGGSAAAAPVARDLLTLTLQRDPGARAIKPPGNQVNVKQPQTPSAPVSPPSVVQEEKNG